MVVMVTQKIFLNKGEEMNKYFKSILSLTIIICLLASTTVTSLAAGGTTNLSANNKDKDGVYKGAGYTEVIASEISKDGSLVETHLISYENLKNITKVIVNHGTDKRKVEVFENNELIAETTFDMDKNTLKVVEDAKTDIIFLDDLSENSMVLRSSSTPSYPYLYYLYSSAWEQYGTLYGEENITQGSTYNLSISAGTGWATAISIVLAVALPGSTAVGILIALGVSAIGVTIDYAVSGKIWAKFYRWDYEVWSQSELGLVTYKTDVYQVVISNTNGNVEEIYVRSEGYSGSRDDMIHQGIYNVYIWNL